MNTERTVWDDLLPEGWQPFQAKAVVFGGLTLAIVIVGLASGASVKALAPLVGVTGIEAAKHIRHWIEWRSQNPTIPRTSPEQRRVDEQSTVAIMAAAVRSRAYVTWTMMLCVLVPTALQVVTGLERSVELASVDRDPIVNGDWWRLLSGTYLHGSLSHVFGNMSALLMYGAILESKTSRLRVPIVYLIACLAGSTASVWFPPHDIPSVGASGGVVGLIAYLFVFSRRQAVKFPAAFRGATATVFFGLIVAGAFGFWQIDNPGHAGGALAGFFLAGLMVDTAQNDVGEPDLPLMDALGLLALMVLVAGSVHTSAVLLQG